MSQSDSGQELRDRVHEAVYDQLDTSQNAVRIATDAADIAIREVLAAIHGLDVTAGDSSDEETLSVYKHLMRTIYGWMR